jgi:hypothetical protein
MALTALHSATAIALLEFEVLEVYPNRDRPWAAPIPSLERVIIRRDRRLCHFSGIREVEVEVVEVRGRMRRLSKGGVGGIDADEGKRM